MVARKTAAEKATAPHRRAPRKYSPDTAGVSFNPAATPTSNPDTHHRVLYTADKTASTSTTLICP
nr:hypothetical protein CPGR_00543 [Mycolicibacterium malmesburyense]